MKRMKLRRDDVCATCTAVVAAGESAWWDAATKQVTCVGCGDAARPTEVEDVPFERGVAGASARREGQRRSAKREERVRARHPRLGGLMLAVSDDPSSTKVWAQGAVGEEKVGAALEAAQKRGIEVKTTLADGVAKQVAAVEAALADTLWSTVPVHGCLCFVDTDLGWFAKPFRIGPVLVTWRKPLIEALLGASVVDEASRISLLTELAARFPPA